MLQVIPKNKRDETLQRFYDDFKALGAGKINLKQDNIKFCKYKL